MYHFYHETDAPCRFFLPSFAKTGVPSSFLIFSFCWIGSSFLHSDASGSFIRLFVRSFLHTPHHSESSNLLFTLFLISNNTIIITFFFFFFFFLVLFSLDERGRLPKAKRPEEYVHRPPFSSFISFHRIRSWELSVTLILFTFLFTSFSFRFGRCGRKRWCPGWHGRKGWHGRDRRCLGFGLFTFAFTGHDSCGRGRKQESGDKCRSEECWLDHGGMNCWLVVDVISSEGRWGWDECWFCENDNQFSRLGRMRSSPKVPSRKNRRKIGEDYPSYLSKFDIASTYGDTKSIARENTSTLLARNVHLSMLHYLYLILEVILSASLCR